MVHDFFHPQYVHIVFFSEIGLPLGYPYSFHPFSSIFMGFSWDFHGIFMGFSIINVINHPAIGVPLVPPKASGPVAWSRPHWSTGTSFVAWRRCCSPRCWRSPKSRSPTKWCHGSCGWWPGDLEKTMGKPWDNYGQLCWVTLYVFVPKVMVQKSSRNGWFMLISMDFPHLSVSLPYLG